MRLVSVVVGVLNKHSQGQREQKQKVEESRIISENLDEGGSATPTKTDSVEVIVEKKRTGFLVFPIKYDDGGEPLTAYTAEVSSVIDHSGTPIDSSSDQSRWYRDNNKVKAFNGEIGDFEKTNEKRHCGFTKNPPEPFFSNKEINYVGVEGLGKHSGNHYLNSYLW